MDHLSKDINEAYSSARTFATNHYENFPVISKFIRRDLRNDVAIIYWFARTADDIADEYPASEQERIELLEKYINNIHEENEIEKDHIYWKALHHTINQKGIDKYLLENLIKAFKQDLQITRYKDFDELLKYCEWSANPVGRIILQLHDIRSEKAYLFSDRICTALQLINFLQDIEEDFDKGRIYIPMNEVRHYEVTENVFELKENNDKFKKLIKFQLERTENILSEGYELLEYLPYLLRIEIKWTILGGMEILKKIKKNNYKIFGHKIKLSKLDFIKLAIKSLL